MTEQAFAGPKRQWKIGRYRFGMFSLLQWDCVADGLGSHGRTPWTAWFHLERWARDYRAAPPHHWIEENGE